MVIRVITLIWLIKLGKIYRKYLEHNFNIPSLTSIMNYILFISPANSCDFRVSTKIGWLEEKKNTMLFSIPLYQLTHRLVSLDYLFPHYFPFFLEMPACRYVITALQIIFSISALYCLCRCRKCTTQQKGSSFLLTRDIASRYGFWSLLRKEDCSFGTF